MKTKARGMESYLDESGITQDDYCVMAGFTGGYNQWRHLERRWKDVVKVLPDSDFHAHIFFNRDALGKCIGPYKTWSDDDALRFLDDLLDAIESASLHPIGAGVAYTAFNQRTLDERIFLTGGIRRSDRWLTSGSPDKPYYLAFQHCVTAAIERAKGSHIKVNFFCDTQKHLAPYAHDLYERYKKRHPLRVAHCGELSYVSRLDINVVQAADLLSHVAYRHRTNPSSETGHALFRLTDNKKSRLRLYDDEGIEVALRNFKPPKLTMGEMNPQAAERERKRRIELGL